MLQEIGDKECANQTYFAEKKQFMDTLKHILEGIQIPRESEMEYFLMIVGFLCLFRLIDIRNHRSCLIHIWKRSFIQ